MSYNACRDLCARRRHSFVGFITGARIVSIGVLATVRNPRTVGIPLCVRRVLCSRPWERMFPVTKAEAMEAQDDETLLTPSEVAAMFRVNPKTVTRWARAGKISAIRTLGGHRRFRASEIRQFLEKVEELQDL